MRIDTAQKAAALLERIQELENVILRFEQMRDAKSFKLSAVSIDHKHGAIETEIDFVEGKLPTEIFQQNILNYTIDNFNIELNDLKEELENLK